MSYLEGTVIKKLLVVVDENVLIDKDENFILYLCSIFHFHREKFFFRFLEIFFDRSCVYQV